MFRTTFRAVVNGALLGLWAGIFWCVTLTPSHAEELAFSPLFSEHAVLQRGFPIRIWGTGKDGEKVVVTFGNRRLDTNVQNGKWEVTASASPAGGPFDLSVESAGQKKMVHDVYVGDVWLAAGQSNMQMNFGAAPELASGADEFLNPRVRVISVRLASSAVPLDSGVSPNGWKVVQKSDLKWISIIGYLFGSAYEKRMKVPVGIIISNQGSTGIETWMPFDALQKVIPETETPRGESPILDGPSLAEYFRTGKPCPPSGLYNAMIAPLVRFPIKGVLWYQGENNAAHPLKYASLLKAMVGAWRKNWGFEMPFVIAQLSSYGGTKEPTGESWAWMREQQQNALEEIPGTALAVTYDLGEFGDIHPHSKPEVARRMLDTYVSCSEGGPNVLGPRMKGSKVEGTRIRLHFETGGRALEAKEVVMNKNRGMAPGTDPDAIRAPAGTLKGFEICGRDQKFLEAIASIDGTDVLVESPSLGQPVAVRYAWKNFALANLSDSAGFPAPPFRTDNFPAPADLGIK